MNTSHIVCALGSLALIVGCGSSAAVVAGDGAITPDLTEASADVARDSGPAPTDLSPMDVAEVTDRPAADVTVMDTAIDAPVMDVTVRCVSNASCAGNPAGMVCDTSTGMCVQCVASADSCPANLHCAGNTCVAGCRSDEGCGRAPDPGDSGLGPMLHCDTMAHACVACVRDEHCPPGNLCVGSVCVTGCTMARPCPTGQQCCSGACIDLQTNLAHCGMCDARCAVANAMPACMNGVCSVGVCTAPFGDCNGSGADGCETNTQVTVNHCGMCGGLCAPRAHSTVLCASGRCEYSCESGFSDCNGYPMDGCETGLNDNPLHCGTCSTVCDPPNGSAACRMGRCAVGMCSTGFGDCDSNATNGCETNTRTTVTHCGACGTMCPERPNAFPGCVAGVCGISCVAGFADCNGDPMDGCETDTRASATNCGACARVCMAPSATAVCAMSVCRVSVCDEGRGDCDGLFENGCETDIRATPAHCGMCANACPIRTNASPVCSVGVCGISCNTGFGSCDAMDANGCETGTGSSTAHCGACGHACAPGQQCRGGVCGSVCTVRFAENWEAGGTLWNPVVTPASEAGACSRFQRETILTGGGRVFSRPGIAVRAGATYCIAAWIRGSTGTAPFVGINNSDAAGNPGSELWLIGTAGYGDGLGGTVAPVTSDGQWHWVAKQFVMPTFSYVVVKDEIWSGGSAGTADFDQIMLIDGACPTPPTAPCAAPVCLP